MVLRKSKLAEIDENLIRNELSALDNGLQTARRKDIYLLLHPETRNGAQGGGKNGVGSKSKTENDIVSFSVDTATKTKKSRRTVERNVEIGTLKDIQNEIRVAKIDKNQKELLELAKLKADSPDIALKALALITEGEAKNVKTAIRQIRKDTLGTPETPAGKYRVIYADPPWSYNDKCDDGAGQGLADGAKEGYLSGALS